MVRKVEKTEILVPPFDLTSTFSRQTLRSRSYFVHSSSETIGLLTTEASKSYASDN